MIFSRRNKHRTSYVSVVNWRYSTTCKSVSQSVDKRIIYWRKRVAQIDVPQDLGWRSNSLSIGSGEKAVNWKDPRPRCINSPSSLTVGVEGRDFYGTLWTITMKEKVERWRVGTGLCWNWETRRKDKKDKKDKKKYNKRAEKKRKTIIDKATPDCGRPAKNAFLPTTAIGRIVEKKR